MRETEDSGQSCDDSRDYDRKTRRNVILEPRDIEEKARKSARDERAYRYDAVMLCFRDDNGDEPLAIGTLSEDDGLISFAPVDKAASDYLNSWRGYFLPMLDNVKGGYFERKFDV